MTLSPGAQAMLDILMLVLGLGFFAVSIAYVYACDRL
jgi:preprotein translocase subunit SecG